MDDISLDAARDALHVLSPADRATRVRIGEALRDEYGDAAWDAWNDWYSGHDRYTLGEAKSAWRSFGKGGGKRCTIATLIYEALRAGFKFNRGHQAKRSPDERRKFEAEREARRAADAAEAAQAQAVAAARAQAIWDAAGPAPADHPYLVRKRIQPHGARWTAEWVKEWTSPETGEIRSIRHANALLIPIWSAPGKLASLQAIVPGKTIGRKPRDGERDERRDKDYLAGGAKLGCYFLFGRIKPDTAVVIICEGFATGASLHEATSMPVMVAFDAGNLEPVAAALRAKLPAGRIVIAADNDQYHAPRGGKPYNPGVEAATKAAEAAKGVLAVPQFESRDGEPKDFNDLACEQGSGAVRETIQAALNPPAPAAPDAPPWEGQSELPTVAPPPADGGGGDEDDEAAAAPANNREFAVMGYDKDKTYVFVHRKRQLMEVGNGTMGGIGLLQLAPLQWWEMHFPGDKGKVDNMAAANFLIQTGQQRGIFDPDFIRGRGAWSDEGRIVFHHGSHLSVDGVATDITAIQSRYIYELKRSMPGPDDAELTSDEGEYLLDLAGKFRWATPGSAALMAGWAALAPVCGALPWRPHIWITAQAGGGKSTALNKYVHWLLGGVDVFVDGSKSTEPGIRQKLHCDARPVLIDEAESNEEGDAKRMQNILALIRQASTESGAQTYKGTASGEALTFNVRSMFCLASIQVALKQKADIDRLTVLNLRSPTDAEKERAGEEWRVLRQALDKLHQDDGLPSRLLRRSLNMLPITLKNIRVFTDAAADRFGRQRDGDQIGTMLAGAWSLISTEVASRDEALELIDRYDWTEHREMSDSDESHKALTALMEAHIRIDRGIEVTVFELVMAAVGKSQDGLDMRSEMANSFLQRYGLKVHGDMLQVSNTSVELKRLMSGTGFEADLRGALLRVPGATKGELGKDGRPKSVKFNGVSSKVVALPLKPIVGEVQARLDHAAPF